MGRIHTLQRRPRNLAEAQCWDRLIGLGWEPWKRGWPDFIAFKNDAVAVIEVKPRASHPLKRTQIRVMQALSDAGIECFRFSPDVGFQKLNPDEDV